MGCARIPLVAPLMFMGVALVAPPSTIQSPSQAPVFKGRLDTVRIDVAVIDSKTGRSVAGLKERDFSVSENGIRQTITSFAEKSGGVLPDPDNRRVFLFLIGAGEFDPYHKHDGVAQFIRQRLRPQDLVGVMSLGRLSPMTLDHERIAAIVDRLKRPMPKEYFDLQRKANKDERSTKGIDEERFADNWMEPGSGGTGFFRSIVPLLFGSTPEQENVDANFLKWSTRAEIYDSLLVLAGIEYLRTIPGEKHIVDLFPGFNPPIHYENQGVGLFFRSADDDNRLATAANNAGVAIDMVQPSDAVGSVMSGENIAQYSGGLFSSLHSAPQQLTRIDEATRNGYIIGYTPSNPELDGKYRGINVTVNRKDATVVYRHGYTADPNPSRVDPREVVTRQRLNGAAAGISDTNDIGLKVQAIAVPGPTPQLRVTLSIDIKELPLSQTSGKWQTDLDVRILCGDKKHQEVCRLDQRATVSLSQAQYDQAKVGGVPYSTAVPLTGAAALVKVIVYHFDSDRIGVFTTNVK